VISEVLFYIWIYFVIGYFVAHYHAKHFISLAQDDPEMMDSVMMQQDKLGKNLYWFSFYSYFIALWALVLPIMTFFYVIGFLEDFFSSDDDF
jgi:hypothetical protein